MCGGRNSPSQAFPLLEQRVGGCGQTLAWAGMLRQRGGGVFKPPPWPTLDPSQGLPGVKQPSGFSPAPCSSREWGKSLGGSASPSARVCFGSGRQFKPLFPFHLSVLAQTRAWPLLLLSAPVGNGGRSLGGVPFSHPPPAQARIRGRGKGINPSSGQEWGVKSSLQASPPPPSWGSSGWGVFFPSP